MINLSISVFLFQSFVLTQNRIFQEKEEPEYYSEFKDLFEQYKERRARKQLYYGKMTYLQIWIY